MERTPIAAVVPVAVPNRSGNYQATKHIAIVRITFTGDVHFQNVPPAGRRKQLHALEWLATENHCPGGIIVVVVEFQCRGSAAGTMNTPGVGDAVRTAETEMPFFPLIVAAEPLIDVASQAEDALLRWVKAALQIQSDQLHKMAKTILQHWDGILGFWHFGNLTNAAMEGFNNKVRTMLRQAYGYRDLEYMRLKIFNLPENNIKIII